MRKPLKSSNTTRLVSLLVANVVLFYGMQQKDVIVLGDWGRLYGEVGEAIPPSLFLALIGLINGLFSAEAKARVVFLQWRNPLPGCEAFTRHALADPRVDVSALEQRYGLLPRDPKEQNVLWYRLYKSVGEEPSVLQVHRDFLFARDYTAISLMVLLALGGLGLSQIRPIADAWIYFAILLVQFLVAGQAARNYGRRFVTTVLALVSAREGE